MMKYLQKLGKALMLPVAVLPICGILMGLGYALAPGVMGVPGAATSGAAYTVGFLLVKAGGALIDNMAWLFAIGAAVGLADNDGTAGLAGLVSFLMMQQLLNPGVVGMVRHLEEGTNGKQPCHVIDQSAACLDQQEANGVSCTGGCSTGNAHNARSKGITKTHQDAADRQDRDGKHQSFAQFLEILHHKAHSSLRNVCVYRRLWLQAVHNSVIE